MKLNNDDLKGAFDELKGIAERLENLKAAEIDEFPVGKTMLVMVDIVNGFINEGAMSAPRIGDIIPPVRALLESCNGRGIKSVAFADCHGENCAEFKTFPPHCVENTSQSEIVDEIKSVGGYTLIPKNSTNGFHEEKFRALLSENPDIDTFIVTGDCTDICVMQFCLSLKTYFTAADRECRIIIPADCADTYDAPYHNSDFSNLAAFKLLSDSGVEFVSAMRN